MHDVDILALSRVRTKASVNIKDKKDYRELKEGTRGWARIISIVSGWKISLFPSYCCFLSLPLGWGICCFGCLERERGTEREVTAPVCVCESDEESDKKEKGGDGVYLGISMLRVSALNVPLSPSLSLILSLTHQSLSPQCPWQLYHQNTPAKEDNCNLSTAERLRARVSENVCVREHVFSCLWYPCVDESVSRCIILYSWGSPLRGESHSGQRSKNLFAVLSGQGQSIEDTCTRSPF